MKNQQKEYLVIAFLDSEICFNTITRKKSTTVTYDEIVQELVASSASKEHSDAPRVIKSYVWPNFSEPTVCRFEATIVMVKSQQEHGSTSVTVSQRSVNEVVSVCAGNDLAHAYTVFIRRQTAALKEDEMLVSFSWSPLMP